MTTKPKTLRAQLTEAKRVLDAAIATERTAKQAADAALADAQAKVAACESALARNKTEHETSKATYERDANDANWTLVDAARSRHARAALDLENARKRVPTGSSELEAAVAARREARERHDVLDEEIACVEEDPATRDAHGVLTIENPYSWAVPLVPGHLAHQARGNADNRYLWAASQVDAYTVAVMPFDDATERRAVDGVARSALEEGLRCVVVYGRRARRAVAEARGVTAFGPYFKREAAINARNEKMAHERSGARGSADTAIRAYERDPLRAAGDSTAWSRGKAHGILRAADFLTRLTTRIPLSVRLEHGMRALAEEAGTMRPQRHALHAMVEAGKAIAEDLTLDAHGQRRMQAAHVAATVAQSGAHDDDDDDDQDDDDDDGSDQDGTAGGQATLTRAHPAEAPAPSASKPARAASPRMLSSVRTRDDAKGAE